MASICGANFTISVTVTEDCTVTIPDQDQVDVVGRNQPITFTKGFTYVIGTDPDTTHTNFGFYLATPGYTGTPSLSLPTGITVTGITWDHAVPRTVGALVVHNNSISATVEIGATYVGTTQTFDLRVVLNTGLAWP